jgi:hypothetical protein
MTTLEIILCLQSSSDPHPRKLGPIAEPPNRIILCKSAMETPHSTKENHRSTRNNPHSTHLVRRTPLVWYIEFFFWYINTPIAHVCWVVTMIDNKGGLTGVRLEEFWRIFKMPSMALSTVWYLLSMLVFPLLASWLVSVSSEGSG